MDSEAAFLKVKKILEKKYEWTYVFNFKSRMSLYNFQTRLLEIIDEFIDVSDFCKTDDSFVDITQLVQACSHLDKPTFMRGLDGCLSLQVGYDKEMVYSQLIRPYKTIGAPLFVLSWNSDLALSNLMESDVRYDDFIFFVDDDNDVESDFEIILISKSIKCPYDCHPNFKSLLKSFEKYQPESKYYLKTNIHPDMFVNSHVKVIKSYKSLTKMLEPSKIFLDEHDDSACWQIYNLDYPQMTLTQTYQSCFRDKDLSECLDDCTDNDFKLWLLLSYCKNDSFESSDIYFDYIIEKISTLKEFNDKMIYGLLDLDTGSPKFLEYYFDRRELIQHLKYYSFQEYAENVVGLKDMPDRLFYLTDLSVSEKETILQSISDYGIINDQIKSILKEVYRDLWYYLDDLSADGLIDRDYFEHYRELKLLNKQPDEKLLETVEDSYAHYTLYEPRNSVFNSMIKKNVDRIFFFDALGVEYIPFIKHVCDEMGLFVDCRVCRANVPTITSENTSILEEYSSLVQKYSELDDIYHNKVDLTDDEYKSSCYIVKVLDSIRAAIEHMAELIKTNQKFMIYSDHGASRMYVLNGQEDTIDWKDVEPNHNGRCAKIGKIAHEPDSRVRVEEKYYVVKTYARFSGIQKAKVESHGGCTLEESIVPLMLISVSDKSKRRLITIKNDGNKVIIDPVHSAAILELVYPVESEKVHINVLGVDYTYCDYSDFVYKFNLFGIVSKSKPIEVTLFDGDDFIDSFEIIIQKAGVKQNKLFGLF